MREIAKHIVTGYRSQCPNEFDVLGNPGGAPSPPKPPAPPSIDTAANAAQKQLMMKKPKGFQSTILAGKSTTGGSSPQGANTVLGGY